MTPIELDLRPPRADEKKMFYSAPTDADDEALATVGHLRADFGSSGKDFQSSWNPHNGDRFNTPEFKAALKEFVDSLRKSGGPLKSLSAMRKYCAERGAEAKLEDQGTYGFIAETEDLNYKFALRFTPSPGQYHLYLYAYDMSRQREYALEKESLLFSRLDESLLRHAEDLGSCPSVTDLHDIGGYIYAHQYLTEEYQFDISETERLLKFEDPLEVALSCAEMDASNLKRQSLASYMDRARAEENFPLADVAPPAEAPRQQPEAAKKRGAGKGGER